MGEREKYWVKIFGSENQNGNGGENESYFLFFMQEKFKYVLKVVEMKGVKKVIQGIKFLEVIEE